MGKDGFRYLMVRIGEVGCLIDLSSIVEIREEIAELLDLSKNDQRFGIVGAMNFRQTRIPAVDPGLHLNLGLKTAPENRTALILKSPEGNWALLVDRVDKICPHDRLASCDIPPLLKEASLGCYMKIGLIQEEPMVVLNPEQFYGSAVAVA